MGEGLQFNNIATQTSDLDSFTMADVMLMMLVDIIIYSLLTWWDENEIIIINPGRVSHAMFQEIFQRA